MLKLKRLDIGLIAILVLAALLRLYRPGLYDFQLDEFHIHHTALDMLHQGRLLFTGPLAGWDGPLRIHSPFSMYMVALPYLFTPDASAVRVLFGVMGVGMVAVIYATMRRYFTQVAALVAALLAAILPLLVEQSRLTWNPSVGLLFIALWIYTGLLGYYDNKRWAQIVHWLCLSASVQSQAALVYMIPLSFGLLIYHAVQHRGKWRQLLITTGIAWMLTALSLLPWMIGAIQTMGDIPIDAPSVAWPAPSVEDLVESLGYVTSSRIFYINQRTNMDYSGLNWFPPLDLDWPYSLQALAVFCSAFYLIYRAWRSRWRDLPSLLIVSLLFFPLGIHFFPLGKDVPLYYLLPVAIAGTLALGAVAGVLWRSRWRWLMVAAVVLFAGAQLWMSVAMLRWHDVDGNRYRFRGPLEDYQAFMATWTQEAEETVFVMDTIDAYDHNKQGWLLSVLDEPYEDHFRAVAVPQGIPFGPQPQIIATAWDSNLISTLFGDIAVETLGELAVGEPVFRYATLSRDDLPAVAWSPDGPTDFSSGARLIGAGGALPQAGDSWTIDLLWQSMRSDVYQQWQFSLRLEDAEGTRYGQVDGPSLPPTAWREGDVVYNRMMMQVSEALPDEGPLYLNILMYTYPENEVADALDEFGNPIGQIISLQIWE